ncbi:MAG: 3'(2'),5'-bisphosphate nucleotidase CysQ [Pseudomonadota bacterium]
MHVDQMTADINTDEALLEQLSAIALKAGEKALEIYHSDFEAQTKSDDSPVTEADRLGEEIILEGLSKVAPAIPVLAEEAASEGKIPELGAEFFLVDPLDGTKEFVNKTGEFTVNIALVRDGVSVLGVVFAPALGRLYAGALGAGAWAQDIAKDGSLGTRAAISARPVPEQDLVAMASRSHRTPETDAFLETLKLKDFAAAGSSLKFCRIAEGAADVYPRFGRTMEWDTGAAHAVLSAAGGAVRTYPEDEPLAYGKKERGFDNPYFIAWGAGKA